MKSLPKKVLCLLLAICLLAGFLPPQQAFAATVTPTESGNVNYQSYYSNTPNIAKSFLYANSNGGLTRVEFAGYYLDGKIVVEDYDSQFRCQSSRIIPRELSFWGGFFAGENYNFFFFSQTNPEESKDKELLRVVKYSKDWQRLGAASLYGINSVGVGSDALRCAEYGGCLYVHMDHTMFRSSDGLRHQSNMSFCVRESDMTVTSGFYSPGWSNSGYVSHSFNQFILVDHEQNLVTLDQGDAYPRAITLFRYNAKAGQDLVIGGAGARKNLLAFPGTRGDNYTGAELGGFAETANGYVVAYNYDGTTTNPYSTNLKDRYVHLSFVNKNLSDVKDVQITTGYDTTTPQLAPTGLDGGYILWNRWNEDFEWAELYYAHYDADGNVGPVQRVDFQACLSDCAPIYWNGKVVWYTTYNSVPTFYTLDSSGLKSYTATAGIGVMTPADVAYATPQTVLLDGKPVTFATYALKNADGSNTNYIKLRDLAHYLNGTNAQFSVDWKAGQGTTLTSGRPYSPNGTELSTPFSGNQPYKKVPGQTIVNGQGVDLDAIGLDNRGFTYYKLRDLGRALGFNVSWINNQIVINTNQPYSDAQ